MSEGFSLKEIRKIVQALSQPCPHCNTALVVTCRYQEIPTYKERNAVQNAMALKVFVIRSAEKAEENEREKHKALAEKSIPLFPETKKAFEDILD